MEITNVHNLEHVFANSFENNSCQHLGKLYLLTCLEIIPVNVQETQICQHFGNTTATMLFKFELQTI